MTDYVLKLSDAELARYQMMAQFAARDERELWTAAGIVEGARVADVGCGPGAVSMVLAGIVGPSGTVYAVDRDATALEQARRWASEAGLGNVVVSEGSADASGLEPGSVDVVMMRHVLAHNGGREQAIVDHLATLVRPGGCVYLLDIEATAMRTYPPGAFRLLDEMSERYQEFHRRLGNDLSVGLRLGDLLTRAGLEQVEHRGGYTVMRPRPGMRPPPWAAREQMLAAGVIDQDTVARWEEELTRLDRDGLDATLFIASFNAAGRRPA